MSEPLRLLYIDDDADIGMIAAMALTLDPGIEARCAGSGGEALAILDSGSFDPDAVILDMMMPEMDGGALIGAIRRRPRFVTMPVLMMTARVQPQDAAEYRALGARGIIVKPFDPLTLAQQVRDLLR